MRHLYLMYECHGIVFWEHSLEIVRVEFWDPPTGQVGYTVRKEDRPDWIEPFQQFIRDNASVIYDSVDHSNSTLIERKELE